MRRVALAVSVAVLLACGAWVAAQQAQIPQGPAVPHDIRTGPDLGFRVREMRDGRAIGMLVVRTKTGEWVEAHAVPSRGFVVPVEVK
jgi:hypothetical protein